MIALYTDQERSPVRITLKGRIDSITSAEIGLEFDRLIDAGRRVLVVDLDKIDYISSAGLRIFLKAQKKLKKVDGEIIFFRASPAVCHIIDISGFETIISLCRDEAELLEHLGKRHAAPSLKQMETGGVCLTILEKEAGPGALNIFGSSSGIAHSRYTRDDVTRLAPGEIRFGAGIAAMGQTWGQYKDYFGEALVLDHNLFFYPAREPSAVDFMLPGSGPSNLSYNFLHGFGFSGDYSHLVSFESSGAFVEIRNLVKISKNSSGRSGSPPSW